MYWSKSETNKLQPDLLKLPKRERTWKKKKRCREKDGRSHISKKNLSSARSGSKVFWTSIVQSSSDARWGQLLGLEETKSSGPPEGSAGWVTAPDVRRGQRTAPLREPAVKGPASSRQKEKLFWHGGASANTHPIQNLVNRESGKYPPLLLQGILWRALLHIQWLSKFHGEDLSEPEAFPN